MRRKMKVKRISCKKLAEYLKQFNLEGPYGPKSLRSSCEAFGKSVFCYLNVQTIENRKMIEKQMRKDGIKHKDDYAKGRPVIEVGVTYFKAWHWDE